MKYCTNKCVKIVILWRSRSVCFPVCVVPCRALLTVVIWCTRAVTRCNRFSVFDGVVLPRVLSCACGAFYKRLLLYSANGVTVCAFVSLLVLACAVSIWSAVCC